MKRLAIWALVFITLLPVSVRANDYGLATNAVIRGWVPWRVAVFLINGHIAGGEERWRAVTSLIQYKSPGLIPYLKSYTKAPEDSIRIAAFWPLYKNGEQAFAKEFLRREIRERHTAASSVFFTPNAPGSDYKIELTRHDDEFNHFVEETAKDKNVEPMTRIYAAIHLTQIGKADVAGKVAKEMLGRIPPDPSSKEYNDWEEGSKRNFHVRKHAEWCLKLAQK